MKIDDSLQLYALELFIQNLLFNKRLKLKFTFYKSWNEPNSSELIILVSA